MKRILFLLPIFYHLFYSSFAQNPVADSLLFVLKTAKDDTNKVNILNDLAFQLYTINPDSTILLAEEAFILAQKLNYQSGIALAYNTLGMGNDVKGNYDRALEFYTQSLKMNEKMGNKKRIAASCNNIGAVQKEMGNYDKSVEYYFRSLKIKEEMMGQNIRAGNADAINKSKADIAYAYNNIGAVFHESKQLEKAMEYYLNGLKTMEEIANSWGIAYLSTNIGNIHYEQGNTKQALEDFQKALKGYEENNDQQGIARSLNNIGSIYYEEGKNELALQYHLKSLSISEEMGDKKGVALSYNNIGDIFFRLSKRSDAINYKQKALQIAQQIGAKVVTRNCYKGLAEIYSEQHNYRFAYEYYQQYSLIKDSIFNEESSKQITEMQTKYETEKKEQQIKLLNKDKEIQSKDLERQKTIRNAVAGGLFLVLLFSFVLINRLLLIRKQKKVIEVEREKSEKLLLNILPKDTADELKCNNAVTPKRYDQVTVMFTDFKGFTTIAEKMSAEELVSKLDFIFKKFDEIISRYPIEKIKTIGDAYMCAGGLPIANTTNSVDVVKAALDIQEFMTERNEKLKSKNQNVFELRIGIHTGGVIAGVVGDKKFAYDIWGDTVNTASRMESSGEAGKVNISGTTFELVKNQFNCIYRGEIEAKNKGKIKMYFVE